MSDHKSPAPAGADKRAAVSIGESIGASAVVAVGQLDPQGRMVLTEVLKGDPASKGHTLPASMWRVRRYSDMPVAGDQVVLFLGPDWQSSESSPLEIMVGDSSVAIVRRLVKIYSEPERTRFEHLCQLFFDCSSLGAKYDTAAVKSIMRAELYGTLGTMRDPKNFDLIMDLYKKAEPESALKILTWLADTRDPRSIPVLIAGLRSPDKYIRSESTTKLRYYWPDNSQVKKALLNEPAPAAAAVPTPYMMAETLYGAGKFKEADSFYLKALQDKGASPYVQRSSAGRLAPRASSTDRARILQVIKPLLDNDCHRGNYLECEEAVQIIGALHDQNSLDDLLAVLDRRDLAVLRAKRYALTAIYSLGPTARAKAAQHIVDVIDRSCHGAANLLADQESRTFALMALYMLGTAADASKVQSIIAGKPDWSIAQRYDGLIGVSDKKNQVQVLCHLLNGSPDFVYHAGPMIIDRLAQLGDGLAGDQLLRCIGQQQSEVATAATDALKVLGKKVDKEKLIKIIKSGGTGRDNATDVLCSVWGTEALPVLRQEVKDPHVEHKAQALIWLGRLGTRQDLAYLVPMSDYWTGDRTNHYWLLQATVEIGARQK